MYLLGRIPHTLKVEDFFDAGKKLAGISSKVFVASDFRAWHKSAKFSLIAGFLSKGVSVLDFHEVPIGFFGREVLREKVFGVHISADPYPPDYTGLKVIRFENFGTKGKKNVTNEGEYVSLNMRNAAVVSYTRVFPIEINRKIAVDGGGGIAGSVAEGVLRALSSRVLGLNTLPTRFYTRAMEPCSATLSTLSDVRKRLGGLGVGFDSAGSKLGVIDERGRFWTASRLVLLLSLLLNRKVALTWIEAPYAEEIFEGIKRIPPSEERAMDLAKKWKGLIGGSFGIIDPKWVRVPDAIFALLTLLEILEEENLTLASLFGYLPEYYEDSLVIPGRSYEEVLTIVEKAAKSWKRVSTPEVHFINQRGDSYIWVHRLKAGVRIVVGSKTRSGFRSLLKFLNSF